MEHVKKISDINVFVCLRRTAKSKYTIDNETSLSVGDVFYEFVESWRVASDELSKSKRIRQHATGKSYRYEGKATIKQINQREKNKREGIVFVDHVPNWETIALREIKKH